MSEHSPPPGPATLRPKEFPPIDPVRQFWILSVFTCHVASLPVRSPFHVSISLSRYAFAARIFHLFWPGDLPLNGYRASIIQLFQPRDHTREIDLALTNRNFLAEISRVGRPQPILGVNSLYVWVDYLDRIRRICLTVQN